MRVVFLGTPEFAVPSLRALIASPWEVCAVFTQPDRPSGRGHKSHSPPVKALAENAGIPIYQPEKIRHEANRVLFESLHPDFVVVAAYGQILPGWLLNSAGIAPVNVHASLLPRYRGAAPVAWAILRGETITGVTTMFMDEHLDTGGMLLKREVAIPEDMTGGELSKILAELGSEILLPTLSGLSDGSIKPESQDDTQATWAPRLIKAQAGISWENAAKDLHNQIRALNPWPLAYSSFQGNRLQIMRSRVCTTHSEAMGQPGTFIDRTDGGMLIACGRQTVLEVLEVNSASKRPVSGREFAVGARLHFGSPAFDPAPSV